MAGLAFQLLRHRMGGAVATFVALVVGVVILMACGVFLESGLRYHGRSERYASADVVIAPSNLTVTSTDFTGETSSSTVVLPERVGVPATLVAGAAAVPGVASATGDRVERPSTHTDRVDAVVVTLAPGADRAAVTAALRLLAAGAGATAFTGTDIGLVEEPAAAAAREMIIAASGSFGGYVALLVIFIVAGTVGLSVRHRRRDLALLRAVAATPGQVRRLVLAEVGMLAVAAAAVGLPFGHLAAGRTRDGLVVRGFVPESFTVTGGALAAPVVGATVALVAVAAALLAARRTAAIRPTEALGEISVEPAPAGRVRAGFGVVCLAGGFALTTVSVATGGFAAIGAATGMLYTFVLGVALLGPWINRAAARALAPVLRTVWGPSGYLAAANLRANARGMVTVLTSLVLAVGFGGSVWFLQDNLERQTIAQSRDGVRAERALVSPTGVPAGLADEVRRLPGVAAATAIRRTAVAVRAFDGPELTAAQGVDTDGVDRTLDLRVRKGSLADLRGGTVAVSSVQAGSSGWDVGETVSMWLGDGTAVRLRVVAIYDRGLGFGDVTLPLDAVAGHTTSEVDDRVLVRAEPGADLDTALAGLAARHPGLSIVDPDGLTAELSADLAVSAWLNRLLIGVMVGYAALAAGNTMVMAALARGRELSLLRLVGVTRRQVRRMVNAEQAGLLGMALLIGGAIAAVTLSSIVNAIAAQRVPYVPPLGWVAILGGTTLLALLATVLPVNRLLRIAPVDGIGVKE
jgi:putative ABC transport system permease protein